MRQAMSRSGSIDGGRERPYDRGLGRQGDRMTRGVRIWAIVGLIGAGLWPAGPAAADHHFMQIVEVYNGTGTREFIELQASSSGQNNLTGHKVVTYNSDGTVDTEYPFTSDPPSGADDETYLLATTAAQTQFGLGAVDLVMPTAGLDEFGGKVCFVSVEGNGNVDCMAWGEYTGSSTGVGSPFSPQLGLPEGASVERTIVGSLDSGDDTNQSAADFDWAVAPTPQPSSSASPGQASGGVIRLASASMSGPEMTGTAPVSVVRDGIDDAATGATVRFNEGTAIEPQDFDDSNSDVSFPVDVTAALASLTLFEDALDEGDETVGVRVDDPDGESALGKPFIGIFTITDNDGDLTKPVSRITKPKNGTSHKRANLTKILGRVADCCSGIDKIQVALRMKRTNGTCRWWTGQRFRAGACGTKRFKDASGAGTWQYGLSSLLPKSVGTNVRFYTVYSRGVDEDGNLETTFSGGRNANRFEIT